MVEVNNRASGLGSREKGHAGPAQPELPLQQHSEVVHVGGRRPAGQDLDSVDDRVKVPSPEER
eukprot:10583735-Alexandrium_andersonii.AAC.1